MTIRMFGDNWLGNFIANFDRLQSQPLADSGPDNNDADSPSDGHFDEEWHRFDFYQDREENDLISFGFTILQNQQVACFESGGEKLLCFPQVLDVIGEKNLVKIKLTIQVLGIVLTECSPRKLDILHKHHIIQPKAIHCGLISQSNAERLCKIFRQTPSKTSNRNDAKNYLIPLKYRHQIRVVHNCFGQQKGILMPQLCTNYDARCIECYDCGAWFSPSDFVGHTHNQTGLDWEMSTCHWGFTSSNWRLYLHLAEDSSRTAEEERSLNDYLTEIKNLCIQPPFDSVTICSDVDQQTLSDSSSFNTSPSMPTPTSLSPTDGLNKIDLQNTSSIFQQCIMRICNQHLETSDDRNQLINTLFMLRQEHHQQISTLISERQELLKALNKSPSILTAATAIPNSTKSTMVPEENNNPLSDNSMTHLQSIKDKIAILKRSIGNKRKSPTDIRDPHQETGKLYKADTVVERSNRPESQLPYRETNPSSDSAVIDCDSSSEYTRVSEVRSCDQQQEADK